MLTTETEERVEGGPRLHCTSCLGGAHRLCSIYTNPKWEGGGHLCVCQCARKRNTRLVNHERIADEKRAKAPAKPRPKAANKYEASRALKWNDERIMALVVLKRDGLTSRQIGERVGAHMDTVRTYLKVARDRGWS